MALRLISGGKGGAIPPSPPTSFGGGGKRRRRRRKHWLSDLLWYATCHVFFDQRATLISEVASRMTKLSKQILGRHYIVSEAQTNHVLGVVRENPLAYGYTFPHAQKGADVENRKYVPIQVDYDPRQGRYYLVDDSDLIAIKKGAISSFSTTATMLRNETASLELAEAIWPDEFASLLPQMQQIANSLDRLAAKVKFL
jgi:hypothetical protein